jgi:hypothetical protein
MLYLIGFPFFLYVLLLIQKQWNRKFSVRMPTIPQVPGWPVYGNHDLYTSPNYHQRILEAGKANGGIFLTKVLDE